MTAPAAIQEVIADLRRLESAKVAVFGSDVHQFRLLPPLPISQIERFERQHRIRLPEDYREFLLFAGRGGAGPFYGLFEFHHMDDAHGMKRWEAGDTFVGSLATPFRYADAWNDLTGRPDDSLIDANQDEYDRQCEAFEKRYWFPIDGAIPICHCGCALRQWLVVSGREAGEVWGDDRADYAGLYPIRTQDEERVRFRQWYRDWLDSALKAIK